MSKKDYYEVLGLAKGSSEDEIKKKYRQLAMQFHPDRNSDPDAEEKFKEAKEAYEILSDPTKRAQYDTYGHAGEPANPFGHGRTHTWNTQGTDTDINEIFKSFFGKEFYNGGATQPPRQQTHVIHITLEEAYAGKQLKVDTKYSVNIPKGVRSGTKFYAEGKIYRVDIMPHHKFKRSNDDLLVDVTIDAIEAMLGVEAILSHVDHAKLQFTIPPGIQPGQIIKLSGKGMTNPETDKPGDVLVRVAVTIPKVLTDSQKEALKGLIHRSSINI